MLIEKLRKEHPQHWKNATAIRVLTLDAVAAANSGHSGMPMGMADVATVLFFNHLKFDPKTPLCNRFKYSGPPALGPVPDFSYPPNG